MPEPVSIPSSPLPSGAIPVTSVPMRFPCTTALSRSKRIPSVPFPEIRFPSFTPVPPMVALSASTNTPSAPLGIATSPALSVPMRLPRMTVPVAPVSRAMPAWALPEIRFLSTTAPPPIVVATALSVTWTPWVPFEIAADPKTLIPM